MKPEDRVAVTLSGGGHRATLFGLGALMYLVDCGANKRVTSIASVSGGSITNGIVGQTLDFKNTDGAAFRKNVAVPLMTQIARRGSFFAPLLTKIYLVLLFATGLLAVVPFICALGEWYVRLPAFLAVLLIFGWMFAQRGRVCAYAFKKTLFSQNGRGTLLNQLNKNSLDHVICATELRSAEEVCFSGSFVYSYCFGHGEPGDLELASAVQASACFPGGFPPSRLPADRHRFTGAPNIPDGSPAERRQLVMTDGGVYDNMGDQWARGFEERLKRWPELGRDRSSPTQLVVVNASARFPWVPFHYARLPLVGEILSLVRMLDVMYVNTTNVRRQEIVHSFDPNTGAGTLPSVLVQIAQSPFVVAEAFARGTGAVAARAKEVLLQLGDTRDQWATIALANAKVGTKLSKLGPEVSSRLVYHAYVVTMCNLYVLFGGSFGFLPGQINPKSFSELIL